MSYHHGALHPPQPLPLPTPSPAPVFLLFQCTHTVFSSIQRVMNTWDVSTPWLLYEHCVLHEHTSVFWGMCPGVGWGHTHQQCQCVGPSARQCHTCAVPAHCCGGGLCLVRTSWVISDTKHLLIACWPNRQEGEPPTCWAGGGGVAQELKHSWPLSGFS